MGYCWSRRRLAPPGRRSVLVVTAHVTCTCSLKFKWQAQSTAHEQTLSASEPVPSAQPYVEFAPKSASEFQVVADTLTGLRAGFRSRGPGASGVG